MLDVREAARQLGLSRSKLYELLLAGEVESVTIGTRRLVPHDALAGYVERLRSGNECGGVEGSIGAVA